VKKPKLRDVDAGTYQVSHPSEAELHSGRRCRPIRDRILCENLDLLIKVTKLALPDNVSKKLARFGSHRSGRPHAVGKILAIGPEVKNPMLQPGTFLLIDALNSSPLKVDEKVYLFPREIAVLCAIDAEDVEKAEEDRNRFGTFTDHI
jgi:hypothetical protein